MSIEMIIVKTGKVQRMHTGIISEKTGEACE